MDSEQNMKVVYPEKIKRRMFYFWLKEYIIFFNEN